MSDSQATGTDTTAAGEPQDTTLTAATQTETTDISKTATETADTAAEIVYDFKAPEGVDLNQEDLVEFTEVLKDKTLTEPQRAQRIVDIAVKREQARAEAFQSTVNGWAEQVKADKELGTPESLAAAAKVIDTFGTPELKAVLNSTGLGNHPEVVRLAVKIGKAISEDKIVGTAGNSNAPRNVADILYGTPTN